MGNKKEETPVGTIVIGKSWTVETLAVVLAEKTADAAVEILEVLNENASLKSENASLKSEATVYQETITELTHNIDELSDLKKVTNAEVKATPSHEGKSFSIDGKEYGFNYPKTSLKRENITVDDVLASEDLQRSLIGMQSGMIYEK